MKQRVSVFSPGQLARIRARWPTPEAFYAERDDRTTRVVSDLTAYTTGPVELHVDSESPASPTVQRTALVAANLTARWARRVRVVLAENVPLAPDLRRGRFTTLHERIEWEMAMADPFGDFAVSSSSDDMRAPRLFIGPWSSGETFRSDDYQVHAAGWSALGRRGAESVVRSPDLSREATVAAAGLAGSLGAADLFKRAIGQERESWMTTFSWDMWDSLLRTGSESWRHINMREVPEVVDLRRMFLGGIGAIGSAFIYLADLCVMTGHLVLLDRDSVDVTNLNRSPLFTVLDALDAVLKTAAGQAYLRGRGVSVIGRDGTWRDHAEAIGDEPFDVWISLTNEDGAWAELPFQLPPLVLHATTTSGWGFGAGRHIPRVEDCTLCRMPRPTAEFRGPCAEGQIDEGRPEIRASLPFLSMAAASLLLGIYMQLGEIAEAPQLANDISADLGVGLRALVALHRSVTPGCRGCQAAATRAWTGRGGRGTFAEWSAA
jgi:hypothetical protein